MSNDTGTCEYTLVADDSETWDGAAGERCYVDRNELTDGVWECPHESAAGSDFCPFHRPVANKDDGAAVNALVDALDDDADDRSVTCFGARFGEFDLQGQSLSGKRIKLAHATVEGTCDWSGGSIDASVLDLNGLSVRGDADFRETVFDAYTTFVGAEFENEANFEGARFLTPVDYRHSVFTGVSSFRNAIFKFGATFASAEFAEDVDFSAARFGGETTFNRATVRKHADFSSAVFEDNAEFVSMRIYGDIGFDDVQIEGKTDVSFTDVGDVDASGIR